VSCPGYSISSATEADAVALRHLHAHTWADTYADLLAPEFYERRLALHRTRRWDTVILNQQASGGDVIVARSPAGLAGLCQFGPTEDPDDPPQKVGHVHRLYVHPSAQRQGVGRSLLAAATERLVAPGVWSLTLWALEGDLRARAFYERLGWRPDGARRDDGATDIRYRLVLS